MAFRDWSRRDLSGIAARLSESTDEPGFSRLRNRRPVGGRTETCDDFYSCRKHASDACRQAPLLDGSGNTARSRRMHCARGGYVRLRDADAACPKWMAFHFFRPYCHQECSVCARSESCGYGLSMRSLPELQSRLSTAPVPLE